MDILLVLVGLGIFLFYLGRLLMAFIRKSPIKPVMIKLAIGFALFFIGIMLMPPADQDVVGEDQIAEDVNQEEVEDQLDEVDEEPAELTEQQRETKYGMDVGTALQEIGWAFNQIAPYFEQELDQTDINEIHGYINEAQFNIAYINDYENIPSRVAPIHDTLLEAISYYQEALDHLPKYIEENDDDSFNRAMAAMIVGHTLMDEFEAQFIAIMS